jgi:cell division protein FtsZ
VVGGEDLGILEVYEAADIIAKAVDPDAQIIFGAVIDPNFPAGQVKLTLIATGFDTTRPNIQRSRAYPPAVASVGQQQPAQPQLVSVPAAQQQPTQPQRTPAQPAPRVTPSFSSSDDLDIPPFLRNRNRQRGQ